MKLSILVLLVVLGFTHSIPNYFKWRDTVMLDQKEDDFDVGEDGAHDITHANIMDHTFDKSAKLRKSFYIQVGWGGALRFKGRYSL